MTEIREKEFTLITGASQGIGKALAIECASRKMNLFLIALPDSGLKELSDWLAKNYAVRVEYLETDLTRHDSYQEVFKMSEEKGLIVNVLINNAGIGYNGKLESMSVENIDAMIMLNVRATTLLTYVYLNGLMKLPKAYILNMGSMAAFSPLPWKSIYAASKSYIMFFSKALAMELKYTNISLTTVYPFGVTTNHMVRERIAKSGMLAKSSVMHADEIARISIDGMLKRKKIIIPGSMGKVLFCTGYLIPQGLALRMLEKVIKKAPH